jgi:hypothetical protein
MPISVRSGDTSIRRLDLEGAEWPGTPAWTYQTTLDPIAIESSQMQPSL